jgi:hypothetical protein
MAHLTGRRSGAPHRAVAVLAAALAASAALTGCAAVKVVKAANHVRHNVADDKATIDSFAATLRSGAATPFAATYVTSGHSPVTVSYAVQPPDDLYFSETPSAPTGDAGTGAVSFVTNPTGEYSCSPGVAKQHLTCQKLDDADATSRHQLLNLYTPSHWVNFLKGLSLAAGLAGDRIGTSLKTVNGFQLSCVDFHATGIKGKSTICTTKQGILGYVKVVSDSTAFAITSFSTSPPATLFALPPGARLTPSS